MSPTIKRREAEATSTYHNTNSTRDAVAFTPDTEGSGSSSSDQSKASMVSESSCAARLYISLHLCSAHDSPSVHVCGLRTISLQQLVSVATEEMLTTREYDISFNPHDHAKARLHDFCKTFTRSNAGQSCELPILLESVNVSETSNNTQCQPLFSYFHISLPRSLHVHSYYEHSKLNLRYTLHITCSSMSVSDVASATTMLSTSVRVFGIPELLEHILLYLFEGNLCCRQR